ncbi:MAG: hypothetical protein V4484_14510 [Pseudomonadota bacterium]
MQKLIKELTRLYLVDGVFPLEMLTQHLQGHATVARSLANADGLTRAIVIAFPKLPDSGEAQHWQRLCEVANAMQTSLGLPAPAVSISGANAYGLWLSLEAPTPVAQVQAFLALLRAAHFPEMELGDDAASAAVELPPCLHQASGKWAAFIHPGLGASFADEPGLEMAPPLAGQIAFLEGLSSISAAQFAHALQLLQPARSAPSVTTAPDGLLLKDATLEDIIQFLHAKNIEPTFRHLLK